jgi:hypothetical protein
MLGEWVWRTVGTISSSIWKKPLNLSLRSAMAPFHAASGDGYQEENAFSSQQI